MPLEHLVRPSASQSEMRKVHFCFFFIELIKDHLAVCHPHKYGFTCVRQLVKLINITNPNKAEPKYKDFIDLVNKKIDKGIKIQSYRGPEEALTGIVEIAPKGASTKKMFQITEVKTITIDQL